MSFILDALKKSENERQRTIGPSLADAPVRRHRGERPWWAFAVAGLLVVNLGVLVIVLTRDDDGAQARPAVVQPSATAPAAVPPTAVPPAATAPASAPRQAPATSPAVRSLAEEAGAYPDPWPEYGDDTFDAPVNPHLAGAANVPAGPSIVRPIDAPAVAPLPSQPTFESRPMAGNQVGNQASNEMLPTAGALIAGGTSLPDLHLDIHVYSSNPAERFVFVNMRKYQEGQTLAEGPTIERITPEGAILNQQGLRYLQPRQ